MTVIRRVFPNQTEKFFGTNLRCVGKNGKLDTNYSIFVFKPDRYPQVIKTPFNLLDKR